MLKYVVAGVVLALAATPALAQFYIVQSKTDKTCKIVETKPADTTTVVIVGDKAFTTRDEAEKQTRSSVSPPNKARWGARPGPPLHRFSAVRVHRAQRHPPHHLPG